MSHDECHQAIIETIARIPRGKLCPYGVIAKLAGYPGKARYVGYILKNLPNETKIPWHRVINAQGKSSFPTNSDRYKAQHARLITEGIDIASSRVNLKTFFW